MGKVFFISDLHFGHEKAIFYDKRPFETVEEMDAELIKRWNAKVGKDDVVYVLGDMIWKKRKGGFDRLIQSLNGQIVLIRGNHDSFIHNKRAKEALAGVKDYDDIQVKLENGATRRCILSHSFIPMYYGHRQNAIHLHGHSHTTDESLFEFMIETFLKEQGLKPEIYNVGCMYWNYEPVTLDEILAHKDEYQAEERRRCLAYIEKKESELRRDFLSGIKPCLYKETDTGLFLEKEKA